MQSVAARTGGSSTFHLRASLSSPRARAGRDTLTRAVARTSNRNHMAAPVMDRTAVHWAACMHVAVLQQFGISSRSRGAALRCRARDSRSQGGPNQTVPFWTHNGTVGQVRDHAHDDAQHGLSHDANPSKWDSSATSGFPQLDVTAGIVRLALNRNGDTDWFFDGREIGHTDTTRGARVMAALVQLTAASGSARPRTARGATVA